jgi:formimidoylglutamate deiminase
VTTLYRPGLLCADGRFVANAALLVADDGRIAGVVRTDHPCDTIVDLPGKALLPGFVNAHSHAFQRLIRGKSESRAGSGADFWSWRGTMYHAAASLDPQQLYDVSRMAFLEMLLAGITTVGEFHYLHTQPSGAPYEDPNQLSKEIIAAAQSVGLRIVLLRSAYLRAGFQLPPDPRQRRFCETTPQFLANTEALLREYPNGSGGVHIGVAPHSIRAVPLDDLRAIAAWARERGLPNHMHISEQPAENEACLREYGARPVALLGRAGLLGPDFTAVHAIHITAEGTAMLAGSAASICACPTTERNLGDGILPADTILRCGIRIALGTDSQAQIDPLEDARELDYHLRLRDQQRAVLDRSPAQPLARRLFSCATVNGARSLAIPAGELIPGACADFFTIDLRDPSVAGHSRVDLLPLMVFGMTRTAIRDVAVNGTLVIRDGRHPLQEDIVSRYAELHGRVWQGWRDSAGARP